MWCSDGAEFPLLTAGFSKCKFCVRSVCLFFNKCLSEALYWSCILNPASKVVLEGVYLPNPVTFSRLLQKRNLKVNKNKSGIVLLRNLFKLCASPAFWMFHSQWPFKSLYIKVMNSGLTDVLKRNGSFV